MTLDSPPMTLTPEAEAQALAAARHDRQAFTPLYRAYVGPLYRYLFSRVGSAADAEDLTSQVFLEALAGLPRYHHDGHFAAWLFTIARRRALNAAARRRPHAPLEWAENVAGAEPDPLASLLAREQIDQVRLRIGDLREDEQDLLRLRFVAGLSFGEMAVTLGRSAEAVKKQTYRLLERLESELESSDG